MARRKRLTPEQEAIVMERYQLWRKNVPKRIAQDMGISSTTLTNYLRRKHKCSTF